jgi:hypothetical protein
VEAILPEVANDEQAQAVHQTEGEPMIEVRQKIFLSVF